MSLNLVKNQRVTVSCTEKEYTALFHGLSRTRGYAYVTNLHGKNYKTVKLSQIKTNKE